eukprot:56532-Amphidinium_carterae.1
MDGVPLRSGLERVYSNAWSESLNAELARVAHEDDSEQSSNERFSHSRRQLLTLLLRDWSKKKVTPLATSLTSPDGVICSEPQAIAAEISRHWSGVFGVPHLMDKDAADIIFAHTPAVTWAKSLGLNGLTLISSCDELVQLLRRMKDSGAGPDGLLY